MPKTKDHKSAPINLPYPLLIPLPYLLLSLPLLLDRLNLLRSLGREAERLHRLVVQLQTVSVYDGGNHDQSIIKSMI